MWLFMLCLLHLLPFLTFLILINRSGIVFFALLLKIRRHVVFEHCHLVTINCYFKDRISIILKENQKNKKSTNLSPALFSCSFLTRLFKVDLCFVFLPFVISCLHCIPLSQCLSVSVHFTVAFAALSIITSLQAISLVVLLFVYLFATIFYSLDY